MKKGRLIAFSFFGIFSILLAGCSSGPSSETAKDALAKKSADDVIAIIKAENLGSSGWLGERPSARDLKLEKEIKNPKHLYRKIRRRIHDVACSKVSRGTYRCSAKVGEKNQKKTVNFTLIKYGHHWTIAG